MYKLLIVEDEEKIRNGLAKRIPWDDLGYTVSGLASNGNEALAAIEADRPDVVLTDVRMPEMGGLELAEIINDRYQDVDILILSGFADFEYARQAIKLKIYDYLLKPTDKEVLLNTFKCLKLKRDQEYFINKKQREKQFHIKAGLEKYKEYFLNKLLQGEYSFIYTIQDQLNSLELNLDGNLFCVCSLYIDLPKHVLKTEWQDNRDLMMFSYNNIISELLNVTGCGAVNVSDIGKVSIIFSFDNADEQTAHMDYIIKNAMNCINSLIYDGCAKIFAGIGKTYNNILHIHTSKLEADKALKKRFFETDQKIFVYDDDIDLENEKRLIKGYREDSNKIVSATVNGQTEELNCLLNELKSSLSEQTDVRNIKNYYYVLCFLLKSSLAEFEMDSDIMPTDDFETCIFNANSLDELSEYVKKIFVSASESIAQANDDSSFKQKVIAEVKHYIEHNYKENLTLKKIGQYVHLSPSYISFLFKEVAGETYTEYLKYIRIQNAKALLKRVNLKIYEIAEKVGYNDYKYFTIQFKKITGMSPTEYRDSMS